MTPQKTLTRLNYAIGDLINLGHEVTITNAGTTMQIIISGLAAATDEAGNVRFVIPAPAHEEEE